MTTGILLPSPEPFASGAIAPEIEPNREQICNWLDISIPTVYRYIKLLKEKVPDEFQYEEGTETFDQKQCKALWTVRCLYLVHKKTKFVVPKLISEGI
jgi:hypothetical protein